jgi:hypothetical protein
MNTALSSQQRGIGFNGFIIGAFLLVLLSITGFRLIPAYMQEAKIKNIFESIAHDPDMQKAGPREIMVSFEKRASIDSVTAIKSSDIDISSEDGKPVLSASYSTKIPLIGNISLFIEFNPSSAN